MNKMNPEIGSALIGAGGSLLGGVLNSFGQKSANKTNLKIARETNAANERLQDKQNEWNLNMWNKQNEYNDPSAQRARLLAAGINPLNGDVNSMPAQQLTSASAQALPASVQNEMSGIGNGVAAAAQVASGYALQKAQIDNIKANTEKVKEDTNAVSIENQWRQNMQDYGEQRQKELVQTVSNLISHGKSLDASTELTKTQKSLVDKTIEKVDEEINGVRLANIFTEAKIKTEGLSQRAMQQQMHIAAVMLSANLSEIYAKIRNIDADTNLKNQEYQINDMTKYLAETFGINPHADWTYNVATLLLNPKSRANILSALGVSSDNGENPLEGLTDELTKVGNQMNNHRNGHAER